MHDNLIQNPDEEALESRDRRLLELRLLHGWMSRDTSSFSLTPTSAWRKIWFLDLPQIAVANDNVLYALCALSATQLTGRSPDDAELQLARHTYWAMALREQRAAVARCLTLDIPDAYIEALTFAALLISMNAFAMLRDRDLELYSPPTEWFQVSKGSFHIFPDMEKLDPGSRLSVIGEVTASIWQAEPKLDDLIDREFKAILAFNPPGEHESPDDLAVHEKALAWVAAFRHATLTEREPPYRLVRRICLFPQLVPDRFIELLEARRPRALVILANFFAVVAHSDALRFFGDVHDTIARREVHAISRALPPEWHGQMLRPLDEIRGLGA